MNIAQWLLRAATDAPERPALYTGDVQVANYAGFLSAVRAAAGRLESLGVEPGDRVLMFLGNDLAYLIGMWATWWLGAAVVPVNAKLHPRELATIVSDAEPHLVLTDAAHLLAAPPTGPAFIDVHEDLAAAGDRIAAERPVRRATGDLVWLFYTSGTTGAPKGVELTHGNLVAMSSSFATDVDPVSAEDTVVYAAPMSHGAGLYAPIHVLRGARHCVPTSGGFDPDEVFALSRSLGRVSMFAAPTMVRRLTRAAADVGPSAADGFRTIVYGGGPMYVADLTEALQVFGDRLVQIYGQGESPMTITVLSREQHRRAVAQPVDIGRLSSVGRPHSVVDVRIVDDRGGPVPSGVVGEVEVSGPTVMRGYWRNPEATRTTLRDGWLRTGDLGFLDAAGYLTLAGRSREVIISGGSNIYPREVEDVLVRHGEVAEAAVIGRTDEEWGERVVALVVPEPGRRPAPESLDRHCLDSLARFKRPRQYVFVPSLPKNAYGKVVRRQLLDLLRTAPAAAVAEV